MYGYSIVILFSLLPNLRAKNLFAIHSFDINEFLDSNKNTDFSAFLKKLLYPQNFFSKWFLVRLYLNFWENWLLFFTFLLMKNTFDWDCICFSKWRGSIQEWSCDCRDMVTGFFKGLSIRNTQEVQPNKYLQLP